MYLYNIIIVGLYVWGSQNLQKKVVEMRSDDYLDSQFKKAFIRELVDGDEFLSSLWLRVRPRIQNTLSTIGIQNVKKLSLNDLNTIERVASKDVIKLRKMASPNVKKSI